METVTDIEKHSAAHILAAAVKRLYSNVKIGIGPVTKEGFFYDLDLGNIDPKDINTKKIEEICKDIISENLSFSQIFIEKTEAEQMLLRTGQIFKAELLKSISDSQVSFFKLGNEFVDLCRGPHIEKTSNLGIIKILNLSEVFWQEDPSRAKLIRITGKLFKNQNDFLEFQAKIKELSENTIEKKLFTKNLISKFGETFHYKENASEILDQIKKEIYSKFILSTTKHLNISSEIEEIASLIDSLFKKSNKSYKELPFTYIYEEKYPSEDFIKIAKLKQICYRSYLNSQNLNSFLPETINNLITILRKLNISNFEVKIICSSLDDDLIESSSLLLEKNLISHSKILQDLGEKIKLRFEFFVNILNQSLGLAYIDVRESEKTLNVGAKTNNFLLQSIVSRFDIDNIFYSLEIDKSNFKPFSISATQVCCIYLKKEFYDYTKNVAKILNEAGYRATVDTSSKSIKYKIKKNLNSNVPVLFLIGKKEQNTGTVSIRENKKGEVGLFSIQDAVDFLKAL